jgi:hypothetical protein
VKKIKPPKEVEDEEQKKIRSSKVKSAVPLVVVPIEDMFDRCWEIHNILKQKIYLIELYQ